VPLPLRPPGLPLCYATGSVVASWQSDFCLLFKLKIFSHLLSMGEVQACASAIATSPVVLRWLCDSPRTGCARRTKIYAARTSNNKRDCDAWSLLLLAATVWSLRTCRSGFPMNNFGKENLKEKIASENIKRASPNRNAIKTAVSFRKSNSFFL